MLVEERDVADVLRLQEERHLARGVEHCTSASLSVQV